MLMFVYNSCAYMVACLKFAELMFLISSNRCVLEACCVIGMP